MGIEDNAADRIGLVDFAHGRIYLLQLQRGIVSGLHRWVKRLCTDKEHLTDLLAQCHLTQLIFILVCNGVCRGFRIFGT